MKKIICLAGAMVLIVNYTFSQNVGIGTIEPLNKLQVQGNLLVTTPTVATVTAPTAPQTKTMVNATTITFSNTDSTGRIYDPGGPAGNYLANLTANINIFSSVNTGIEFTVETMDLGTGDSLIIKETSFSTNILLAVGNGYTTTGKWVFNSDNLYIIFKSNADANTGTGFSLLFKRLYDNSSILPDVSGVAGNAFFADIKNGSFRSGFINNDIRGNHSTALGNNTTASGAGSTAIGSNTSATGTVSIAMGANSIASGYNSIAMGSQTNASGHTSTAMGNITTASGLFSVSMGTITVASGSRSTAMGSNTTASGDNSTAMGSFVNTNNHNGAFLIGDNSTTNVMHGTTPNNFRARFDGGYRFYTSSDYSSSCALSPGANAWSTTSDVRLKENFATVNGEEFLKKIAGMKLVSWNYKKQDPAHYRHYGPMAQDFYAAFGKDNYGTIGNDTTINSADFAGVSFIAIQALEKRSALQQQEFDRSTSALKNEINEINKIILLLRKELDQLKNK